MTSGFATCAIFIDILETTMMDPAIMNANPAVRHPVDPPSLEAALPGPKLGKHSRANSSHASSGDNQGSLDDTGRDSYKRLCTQLAHFPIPVSSSHQIVVSQSPGVNEPASGTLRGHGSGSRSVQGGWNMCDA
jgi:hypothetical protein